MAKLSIIARDNKKEGLVKRYAEKRKALKAAGDYAALGVDTSAASRNHRRAPVGVAAVIPVFEGAEQF